MPFSLRGRKENSKTAIDFKIVTLENEVSPDHEEIMQDTLNEMIADGVIGDHSLGSGYVNFKPAQLGNHQQQ